MPTKTFFNLPKEKQNKIIAAARQVFANKDVEDVKISDIVSKASIPRGSFYQYFSDLNDLFLYVFYEHWSCLEQVVDNMPKADNIYDVFRNSLYALYPYYMKRETNELVRKSVFYIKKDNALWLKRNEKLRARLKSFKDIAIKQGISLPDKELDLFISLLNKIKDDLMDTAYENGWSLNRVLETYDKYISFFRF